MVFRGAHGGVVLLQLKKAEMGQAQPSPADLEAQQQMQLLAMQHALGQQMVSFAGGVLPLQFHFRWCNDPGKAACAVVIRSCLCFRRAFLSVVFGV